MRKFNIFFKQKIKDVEISLYDIIKINGVTGRIKSIDTTESAPRGYIRLDISEKMQEHTMDFWFNDIKTIEVISKSNKVI